MTLPNVRIIVRPRIHLGLLSMHEGAPRMNGGIGFAVEGPVAEITVTEAEQSTIYDERSQPMALAEIAQLSERSERFISDYELKRSGKIRILGEMRTHVGMGSATAIRLGVIEAIGLLNQRQFSKECLIGASGRGGTSGVGINTYFSGGLICDLGHLGDGRSYAPSSRSTPSQIPLALPSVAMPIWPMLLCVPRFISPKNQEEEVDFFQRTTPLSATNSFEASYVALFEIYAAAVEGNYKAFCKGINQMQHTAWKQAERAEYGAPLHILSQKLFEQGADCVGMSSLGPMLFCFADYVRLKSIANFAESSNCDVFWSSPANTGRVVN